jgi:hypothetical protein
LIRTTQRRFVSAEIDISRVDSHDGAVTQRRVVSAEIYSETHINITEQSTPIAQNKLINEILKASIWNSHSALLSPTILTVKLQVLPLSSVVFYILFLQLTLF